ncbi:MAG: hypothetical protein HDT43_08940 [Ruminococcaceae bacterium]|nr:hypothetical protein [Oscillospiraceae bacterium]
MKNNKKIIAAAVLAAVCFTGCSANIESGSAPSSYSTTMSSDLSGSSSSSSSSTSSSEETISSEPVVSSDSSESGTDNDSSVSAPASSSSSAASSEEETESKPPRVITGTVDVIGDNSSNSYDDKSIGVKVPKTAEEKLIDELIDELDLKDDKKSDMEKLCILGKWFCDNTEYDYQLEATGSYGLETKASYLLTKHSGVCATYAETACFILSQCGIDTLYCDNGNSNHAWNAVKIDGQWTYTDFVGGPEHLLLGSSYHGLPDHTFIYSCHTLNGYGYGGTVPDMSEINTDLRLFDFDGNELEVHKEADGFSYVDSNGKGHKVIF